MRYARAILATIVLLTVSVSAEPVNQLHPTNFVNDFAHVLNAQTENDLNSVCEQLDHEAKAQIAVVTVNTLEGEDVESYAVDLFHKWGIGGKSNDHGVLILLAIKDHRGKIEVGYGLEPILPDGKTGGFNREAIPFLKQGDYDAAMRLMTMRVAEVIAQAAGIQLKNAPAAPRPPIAVPGISIGGVLLLIILALIVLGTPLRKMLFWWLLFGGGPRWGGGYRSGGGGGWGGGGFGGGSGGGFGGFGGGSSGGGGSSFGW